MAPAQWKARILLCPPEPVCGFAKNFEHGSGVQRQGNDGDCRARVAWRRLDSFILTV